MANLGVRLQESLAPSFIEEDVQVALLLTPILFPSFFMVIHFDVMLLAELPPEPVANLIASFPYPWTSLALRAEQMSKSP